MRLRWIIVLIFILAVLCAALGFNLWRKNNLPQTDLVASVKSDISKVKREEIGLSVLGRKIEAYSFGNGTTHIVFVGGIHGGYEWNTVLLAYKFIDYLEANPTVIPSNLTITVIPSANPDGIYKLTGKDGRFTLTDIPTELSATVPGRFNGHTVDLNRNFACNWQATGTWQNKAVNTGTKAFSEPEASALRDFILAAKPTAVIFWHSQSGSVYASECNNGILPITLELMNKYAKASGYQAVKNFAGYKITGDAEGWLASINIPAITVELKTHNEIEWDKNLAGIKAIFEYYKK